MTGTANTDANGSYRLTALPVGGYEVSAQEAGFKLAVWRPILQSTPVGSAGNFIPLVPGSLA